MHILRRRKKRWQKILGYASFMPKCTGKDSHSNEVLQGSGGVEGGFDVSEVCESLGVCSCGAGGGEGVLLAGLAGTITHSVEIGGQGGQTCITTKYISYHALFSAKLISCVAC